MTRFLRIALVGSAVALAAPAAAVAAPPTVTTGKATDITQTTATLKGTLNPRGNVAFAFFEYGTSKLYGAQTPSEAKGQGTTPVDHASALIGLQPFTTYHYRIVAQYGNGSQFVLGKDRTLRTDRQPLGLTLGASPLTVRQGGSTTISGNLSGTDNAGRDIQLMANPYPFSGFTDVGNVLKTDAAGNFSFPILSVQVNTVYRVRLPDRPALVSPDAPVNVQINVKAAKMRHRVLKGHKVTFRGRVTPGNEGAPVEIQRKFRDIWVTVRRTRLDARSHFNQKLRLFQGGKFRVLVSPGTAYIAESDSVGKISVFKKRRKK
jgi:hypothetical protein